MKSEAIELVVQYKDGTEIKENTAKVFASKKSVSRNEFYAAYGVGLRPGFIFVIHPAEFKLADIEVDGVVYSATHVRHNRTLYEIVRTYQKDIYNLEITVK